VVTPAKVKLLLSLTTGVNEMKIQNNYEALVCALKLAINAPTDGQSQKCVEMAEGFASTLTNVEIERAKDDAVSTAS